MKGTNLLCTKSALNEQYKILLKNSQDLKHFLANPFGIHMVRAPKGKIQARLSLPQEKGLGPKLLSFWTTLYSLNLQPLQL